MAGEASANPQRVLAPRPRHRIRELDLVTEDIGGARLSDREGHSARPRVGSREVLRFPKSDRVAVQIGDPRFIEKSRAHHRGVIDLRRPRASRIPARHTGSVGAADRVLGVVVVEAIDVDPQHQVLTRRQLVVETRVEKGLTIVRR